MKNSCKEEKDNLDIRSAPSWKKIFFTIVALIGISISFIISICNSNEYGRFEKEILLCRTDGGTVTTTITLSSIRDKEENVSFWLGCGKIAPASKESYYAYERTKDNEADLLEMPREITKKHTLQDENSIPYAEILIDGYGIRQIDLYVPENAEEYIITP